MGRVQVERGGIGGGGVLQMLAVATAGTQLLRLDVGPPLVRRLPLGRPLEFRDPDLWREDSC